jgi:hypothetical protein
MLVSIVPPVGQGFAEARNCGGEDHHPAALRFMSCQDLCFNPFSFWYRLKLWFDLNVLAAQVGGLYLARGRKLTH